MENKPNHKKTELKKHPVAALFSMNAGPINCDWYTLLHCGCFDK